VHLGQIDRANAKAPSWSRAHSRRIIGKGLWPGVVTIQFFLVMVTSRHEMAAIECVALLDESHQSAGKHRSHVALGVRNEEQHADHDERQGRLNER